MTTTTGQRKGTVATTPPAHPFPLPFTSDFETDDAGNRNPRFFADIEGGFDLVKDDQNQFLEQQMVIRPINWTFYDHYNPQSPLTQIGDPDWTDCDLSVDVQIPPDAFAQIFVRVAEVANYTKGYSLKLYHSGAWELLYDNLVVLGSGYVELEPEDWNQMGLKVEGEKLTVTINGKTLKTMTDKYATKGMVALGCSWHKVRFDNFSIHH
jgi:hypothetical protein